jgi:GR25 family glycosyltransferase involved in LPS biosynthesis
MFRMKKRLLYICPHLSTGGLPQYTYKQIQSFLQDYDIAVVEINDISGDAFIVQKQKIEEIATLYTLGEDKEKIHTIIKDYNPDIIHFQEIPEFELSHEILDKIFDNSRTYNIIVTTHGSNTDPTRLKYHPDRYILVSEWSRERFTQTGVETDVWEYPVEKYEYNKSDAKKELDFDPEWKHVLNVGLFTPGKNQKEIFDVARMLESYKIKFHFVGNQAGNFEEYWKPLMDSKPANCVIWGERSDVDKFYKAADIFYFPSTLELNPISIKEAISYNLPCLFRKLPTYLDMYDENELVTYIDDDQFKTKSIILKTMGLVDDTNESVITSKPRIQIKHLLTNANDVRELVSIPSIRQLENCGMTYQPMINQLYDELPPAENCRRPEHLSKDNKPGELYSGAGLGWITGRHYGCYLAHRNALETIDTHHFDYTLIFEADAYITSDYKEFDEIIHKAIEIMERDDVYYLSFSNNPSIEKTQIDTNFSKTSHTQTGAHAYIVRNKDKSWWLDKIKKVGWDSADLWYNYVFADFSQTRYTTNKIYSWQCDGVSLLDDVYRYTNNSVDNRVSIVLSYADTDYRKRLLRECLESINTPIILSSHYPIETNTQLLSDWVLYDKNNPLLYQTDYTKYNVRYYKWWIDDSGNRNEKQFEYEHSYAVYTLIQNALRFAKSMGKSYVNIINYDYIATNDILNEHIHYLENGYDVVFYKYHNTSYCSAFFSGKVEVLMEYFNRYTSIAEFYTGDDWAIFEEKLYNVYSNSKFTIKELDFSQLENTTQVNREGVLEFSKNYNE